MWTFEGKPIHKPLPRSQETFEQTVRAIYRTKPFTDMPTELWQEIAAYLREYGMRKQFTYPTGLKRVKSRPPAATPPPCCETASAAKPKPAAKKRKTAVAAV